MPMETQNPSCARHAGHDRLSFFTSSNSSCRGAFSGVTRVNVFGEAKCRIALRHHYAGPPKPSCFPSLYTTVSSSTVKSRVCRAIIGDSSHEYGPYPWDPSWNASGYEGIEWHQEDIVTFFTSEGLIQIGGTLVPHQPSVGERRQFPGRAPTKFRRYREEDYMDPKQGLCLGAIFDIIATNGLDRGRRLCVFGFCRSVEMLSDVVEDAVLEQGGEVMLAAKDSHGGLQEKLVMKVAVPLLWGVPPATESLNYAIRCGGGIVDKISFQWQFF
ncbi:hypothetical protein KP509_34G020800 [Ceratopteris richardii]|uniref:DUF7811 domain-containing protein n=1 Tax=Ceratopteris richardii TaxID=49495 RepID=A0A8T2QJX9_CERRI|nr:hypothetical protein KP509_34G020800 [Ceratopteris richardii]